MPIYWGGDDLDIPKEQYERYQRLAQKIQERGHPYTTVGDLIEGGKNAVREGAELAGKGLEKAQSLAKTIAAGAAAARAGIGGVIDAATPYVGRALKTPLMMTESQMELLKQDALRRAIRQQMLGAGGGST